jgi:hypothetical protein
VSLERGTALERHSFGVPRAGASLERGTPSGRPSAEGWRAARSEVFVAQEIPVIVRRFFGAQENPVILRRPFLARTHARTRVTNKEGL